MQVQVVVFDTSVMVYNPKSLLNFTGSKIVVPSVAIKQLQGLKTQKSQTGANARHALHLIEDLQAQGDLGIEQDALPKRVTLRYKMASPDMLPAGLNPEASDEKIIRVALSLRDEGHNVAVASTDVDVRLMAHICGLEVCDYGKHQGLEKLEDLYDGTAKLEINPMSVPDFFREKHVAAKKFVSDKAALAELIPNQCCYLTFEEGSNTKTILGIYKYNSGDSYFRLVLKPKVGDLTTDNEQVLPRNAEQSFAYALLTDPKIELVTITGVAGTGKTLMATLAAYEQLGGRNGYGRITAYRPIVEMGVKDLGYLPGTVEEKFAPWMRPVIKNFNLVLRGRVAPRRKGESDRVSAEDYIRQELLEITPANYVLGDTWHNEFVIIDEAQNFEPSEIKTLTTRPGWGTKIAITGDPSQVHHPHLDAFSNGLVHAIEGFKGEEICAHITMVKGERSKLAELAAKKLR